MHMDYFGYDDYGAYGDMGVYTPETQFNLDPVMLQSLGFTPDEIQALEFIVMNEGKATTNTMVQYYGIPYEQAQKLRYMYDICTGKVIINSEDDLSKHLRKMFGKHRRIGIADLATSSIGEVPRTALVAGIPADTPFAIWNSKQYPIMERMYSVVDVSGQNVIIETTRKPVLKYKESKSIEGILEIKELKKDGKVVVAINRQYCRLCNRFVIVASLRRPEFHHGLVEIICMEGTKVYVFADTMAAKKYSRYGNNTQRVYDYGFYPFEIQSKLMASASKVYQSLCGVYAMPYAANSDFIIIPPDDTDKEEDDILIE